MSSVKLIQILLIFLAVSSERTSYCLSDQKKTCLPQRSARQAIHFMNQRIPSCSVAVEDFGYGNLIPGPSERPDGVLPEWIDIPLAIRGQEFFNSHLAHVGLGNLMGISAALMYPGLADMLLYTGANLEGGGGAAKRYTSTLTQIMLWSRNTFRTNNSIENIERSLKNVGKLHSAAANRARKTLAQNGTLGIRERYYGKLKIRENLWNALKKDMAPLPAIYKTFPDSYQTTRNRSIPMNQLDFALVQWSATGLMMFRPEKLLVYDFNDETRRAFAHLWAVIGYAMGLDDEYNLCLQPDLQTLKKVYKDFAFQYIIPGIYNAEWHSKGLVEAVAASTVDLVIPIYKDQIVELGEAFLITRTLTDYLDLKTPNLDRVIGDKAKWFLKSGWSLGVFSSKIAPNSFNTIGNVFVNSVVSWLCNRFFPNTCKNDRNVSIQVFHQNNANT